jgi:hypothetical protein
MENIIINDDLLFYSLMAAVAGIAASAMIGFVLTKLMIGQFETPNRVSHEQAS